MKPDRVVVKDDEIVAVYPGIGALFVSMLPEGLIIEAVVVNDGSSRPVLRKRHRKLLAIAKQTFGDFQHHDPMNYTGLGATKVGS